MRTRWAIPLVVLILLALILFSGCGPGQLLGPTATPQPTPTPTLPPTPTSPPGGLITGRVYLMDRDEPVVTTVKVEGTDIVTSTDEDGYYSILMEEAGAYSVMIEVTDLLDVCDSLRTESGGWLASQEFDTSGLTAVYALSMPQRVDIGDELVIDCELFCD